VLGIYMPVPRALALCNHVRGPMVTVYGMSLQYKAKRHSELPSVVLLGTMIMVHCRGIFGGS
jgi:hypothetical protein